MTQASIIDAKTNIAVHKDLTANQPRRNANSRGDRDADSGLRRQKSSGSASDFSHLVLGGKPAFFTDSRFTGIAFQTKKK